MRCTVVTGPVGWQGFKDLNVRLAALASGWGGREQVGAAPHDGCLSERTTSLLLVGLWCSMLLRMHRALHR
jgi:hypothetical protein